MSATEAVHPVDEAREPAFGFWRRSYAMLVKEFIQLRRDRVSFAMIVMIPVMQLLLFGYAINTTPRHLPTAVLVQEDSDLARSVLKAMENTSYFRFTREVHSVAEFDDLLQSGKVLFGVEIPRGFERAVRRGDKPALLVAADATDPVAAGSALGSLGALVQTKGLMELVVLTVLLDRGIISANAFSALTLMAVITTLLAMPLARFALSYKGRRHAVIAGASSPMPAPASIRTQYE